MNKYTWLIRSAACLVGTAAVMAGQPSAASAKGQQYIVMMKDPAAAAYEGGVPGLAATKPDAGQKLDANSPAVRQYVAHLRAQHEAALSAVSATETYDYALTVNGFAAELTDAQVRALSARPDVLRVVPRKLYNLDTNNTPAFLGLNQRGGPWRRRITGEGVVVAILDGGIWPEHPCFADVKTPIRGDRGRLVAYDPPPESFTGTACEFGNTDFNPEDQPFECNNKLVQARFYGDGFLDPEDTENLGFSPGECLSARDCGPFGDHGSNVAGTTACNATTDGIDGDEFVGNIAGMAPRAHIAHYKVCWSIPTAPTGTCANVDLVAAIEQAIADGVDVMNLSLGSDSPILGDAFDLALFNATAAGIFVVTSAGNNGPEPGTVGSPATAPWVTSVAAMQDPDVTATGLEVQTPASIADTYIGLEGAGPVTLEDTGDIVADVAVAEPLLACEAITNPEALAGKIALVSRGACSFNDKYLNVQAAGASAIVVFNDGADDFRIDPIVMGGIGADVTIPGIMIGFFDGQLVQTTLEGGEVVSARLSPDIAEPRGDRIASFSSRGPNGFTPDLLKPDVAAPGVAIFSAGSPLGGLDEAGGLFSTLQGTSFSSPHVAGLMALIRQAHPDWSPAQARSAYMTTARQNIQETFRDDLTTAFDIGGGMVVPSEALDPGLVYDAGPVDYAGYACGQGIFFDEETCALLEADGVTFDPLQLNYPGIVASEVAGEVTVKRTVTSVAQRGLGRKNRNFFYAHVDAPDGYSVHVRPSFMFLAEGESRDFEVIIRAEEGASPDAFSFGSITWQGLRYKVRSPIAVQASALTVPDVVFGEGPTGSDAFDVSFGYTGEYTAQVHGLNDPTLFLGTVEDDPTDTFAFFGPGTTIGFLEEVPEGTALVRFATFNEYTSGNDDLDIYVYYCPDFSCALLGSSATGDSNESFSVPFPLNDPNIDDPYLVFVHGFNTEGGLPADFALFVNQFGLVDDAGNLAISAPTSATTGQTETISFEWNGLPTGPGFKQLGAISHSDANGILDLTLIDITNDQGFGLGDIPPPPPPAE
ncbi:MAG: S8 family serine peptidase [Myxococcota bacterium]